MAGPDPGEAPGFRILVTAEALFGDDPAAPRPLADAPVAIERLRWIGEPVLLVGEQIAGRRLPAEPAERLGWIRAQLDAPDLALVAFDDAVAGRTGDAADALAVERWSGLRREWHADRLVTGLQANVGPARRAGLTVVHVGPRGSGPGAAVERAEHEARDLRDAVTRLMAADTFEALSGR